jgi:Cu/Ag efflux pump CusA
VIGGLIFATCATLFLVPTIFSLVHSRKPGAASEPDGATIQSH